MHTTGAIAMVKANFEMPDEFDSVNPFTHIFYSGETAIRITCSSNDDFPFFWPCQQYVKALKAKGLNVLEVVNDTGHGSYDPEAMAKFLLK